MLVDDTTVDFLLYDVIGCERLVALDYFSHCSREQFDLSLTTARKLAREVLWPLYQKFDREPPVFENGRIRTHEKLGPLYAQLAEAGLIAATRPLEVDGLQLPQTISLAMSVYLSAGNMAAACYVGLTAGAAHLIESFGSDALKQTYMTKMYAGRWTGTMCLTEPQAGSSLADVRTRATPQSDGSHRLSGNKVFISGGDNTFAENIVHLVLARIDGAPAGTKGVSLFCVPRLRPENDKLVDNDVKTTGLFHKMGWKALPSIALTFGEDDNCKGWLVGEPNQGLRCMFQMMNGARLAVGMSGVATAAVGYEVSLNYAKTRPQGRPLAERDAKTPQVPIIRHADVRRMLLAQKAIVEGGLSLVLRCGLYADLARHSGGEAQARAQKLLDFLTPIAKSFPAEKGFESNALAVQVHGGYGYTEEYLPELLLREQKLNSLHEGTTGIQSLDLLARKVFADAGQGAMLIAEEIREALARASKHERLRTLAEELEKALSHWATALASLGGRAAQGQLESALAGSVAHLELAGILVIAWQLLDMAAGALDKTTSATAKMTKSFAEGKVLSAQYWFEFELIRVPALCALLERSTLSYLEMSDDAF